MKEVRIVSLQGLDKYDVFMQDFMYGDTRIFAFHNRRDLSIDEHHSIEYGFYKGVLFHDSSIKSIEPYYFPEKNVFDLSKNGYNATLFYLNYGDNYKSSDNYKGVSLHKLDCRTKKSICFSKRDFNLSGSEPVDDFFRTLTFVGINERYVFISFVLGLDHTKYNYVVDSLSGEWLPVLGDLLLNNLDSFSILGSTQSNYIVIKTGQYTPEEKMRWWKDNHTERVDEHIIVIKDQEFIELVRNGSVDLLPYVIDTCTNQSAQSGYIFDSDGIVYYTNHFDSSTTSITRYNPLTFNKEELSYSGLHSNVLYFKNQFYSFIDTDEKQILSDLDTMKNIITIHYPDKLLWLDDEHLLMYSFLSNGNMRITSKNKWTNHITILGEGICFVDRSRDVVTIIERPGM
ncbi:hypothetical protein [Paenibacillus aquistagni]|uniref:hypothetical protein n=1 Tax=Paenibacillus aquistagni TaxID=1852522 RepID=UPI0011323F27|nr:hypothetical protein [Paenibacillus aquistagni]